MMQAISKALFLYSLENFDSVLIGSDAPEGLLAFAQECGGKPAPIQPANEQGSRRRPAHTHEDRVEAWDGLISDLRRELNDTPYKLTLG